MNMNVGLGHHVFPIAKANNTQIEVILDTVANYQNSPSYPFPLLKTF